MKKVISLILLISILFSTFAGMGVTSNAENGVYNKIVSLQKKYPDGKFWNHLVTNDSNNGDQLKARNDESFSDSVTSTPCANHYGTAKIGQYDCTNFDDALQCWGFAAKIFYETFGERVSKLPKRTDKNNISVGDYLRYGSDANGHSAIVLTRSGNSITVVECNNAKYGGNCNIHWGGASNISEVSYFKHASNWDTINKCSTHKWDKGKVTTKATCTSNGVKTYTCTVCGETKTETIKGGHKYSKPFTVKVTLTTNGLVSKQCSVCKKAVKTVVYHPKTYTSNKLKVTYNGKYQKPGVTVKDAKGKAISSKYYTLSYKNNRYVGTAIITIKFKGLYSGTKKVAFMIAPKGTALKAVKGASSSAINVYWNKQATQTSGYQVQYSTDSKFAKNNKSFAVKNTAVAKKLTGLKSSTKYYFRIRTYKKVNSVPYYSGWSKVLSAKTSIGPDAKAVLLNKVKKLTSRDIQSVYYADYDGDGKKELFAITNNSSDGELYFASTQQVKKILKTDNHYHIYNAKTPKVSKKQTLFSVETGMGGAWADSVCCYYVKAGKVYGKAYGKKHQNLIELKQLSGGYFTISESALDGGRSKSGIWGFHTWKPYYLKWTGTQFVEYKGELITKNDITKYSNGKSVLSQISSAGYVVDKIYRRSNGIININVHKIDSSYTYYDNVNLRINGKKLQLIVNNKNANDIVGKSTWGGIYKAGVLN